MKSIYLIGFMGSGKTTVANGLSQAFTKEVLDTDEIIVQKYHQSIPEIFQQKGESTFREYESSVLFQTPTEDTIIATGGGIIEKVSNRKWLKENGISVFLKTSWEEINQRLINDTDRPIWNNQSRNKKILLEERIPKYEEVADIIVHTDGKSIGDIVKEIQDKLLEMNKSI